MKYLYVVDLQTEFVKDKRGQQIYNNCINFIRSNRNNYDAIYAAVYKNRDNVNMNRYVGWNEMQKSIDALDFVPDDFWYHSGYAIDSYPFKATDKVDVIGFDTDACVLNACFDLFNLNVQFRVLVSGCWSSGGASMHKAGLEVMKRQFRNAVDERFKV